MVCTARRGGSIVGEIILAIIVAFLVIRFWKAALWLVGIFAVAAIVGLQWFMDYYDLSFFS